VVEVPARQVLPSQQPLQELEVQTQLPPTHACPLAQTAHCPPPVPQWAVVLEPWQVPLCQQMEQQEPL